MLSKGYSMPYVFALVAVTLAAATVRADIVEHGDRVVFLGDSNTYAGPYVTEIASQWLQQFPDQDVEFINCGLSSETACGLSEPAHPFPRPNVQERVDRVLEKLKPDVLVICYGMNDGIYHPFDQQRFEAYQAGIQSLVRKGKAAGAKVVLLTPPPFDAAPLRKRGKLHPKDAESFNWTTIYEDYDDVMATYAKWVLTQRDEVDAVVDIRTPFVEYFQRRRLEDPDYSMSRDGVHFNDDGHRLIAEALLKSWGVNVVEVPESLRKQVKQAQMMLRDSSLSHVGHLRPGIKPGLPWAEAQQKAEDLLSSIKSS